VVEERMRAAILVVSAWARSNLPARMSLFLVRRRDLIAGVIKGGSLTASESDRAQREESVKMKIEGKVESIKGSLDIRGRDEGPIYSRNRREKSRCASRGAMSKSDNRTGLI